MKRFHAMEFEDLHWFPEVLRDAITAHLHKIEGTSEMDAVFLPYIQKLLEKTNTTHIVDLCSGAGGPLPAIMKRLHNNNIKASAILTDKFPNFKQLAALAAEESQISYSKESIDAIDTNIPGIRTLFNAFHHFRPEQARSILKDSIEKNQSIGIFEFVERSPGALMSVVFSALGVFVLMPFIKPRRLPWFAFTYLIPLVPLLILWDGTVSCFRVYSTSELQELVKSIPGHEKFHWEITQKRLPYLVAKATILLGYPKDEATA